MHPHLRTMLVDLATISDWKVGWVAETTSLLNWRAGLPYRGFESPTFRKRSSKLHRWSIHLMVRIQDSQSWHRGSIPLSTTILKICWYKSAKVVRPMQIFVTRSIHLMVRIQDSQSWHRGSIPLSTTKCFHVLVIVGKLAFSLYDYCKLFFCPKAGKTRIQQSSKHLGKKVREKFGGTKKI